MSLATAEVRYERLRRAVESMTPARLRRFAASLEGEDLALLEEVVADMRAEGEEAAAGAVHWRADPARMACHFEPGVYQPHPYFLHLGRKFTQLVDGSDRFQVWMVPAQAGKSGIASQYGPAWLLDRDPTARPLGITWGDDLADRNGLRVRDILEDHSDVLRARLRRDQRRKDRFLTAEGGGFYSAGIFTIGGGWSASGVIIDDPYKGWEQAHSAAMREKIWNIIRSVVILRQANEDFFVLLCTCLAGGTPIPLTDGRWVPIERVRAGDEVWAWGGAGLVARRVIGQRCSGAAETLSVVTDRHRVTMTATHPVLVTPWHGRFAPRWKRAGELVVGDVLVAASSLDTEAKSPVPGWDSPGRMWLLGFLFGDGWVTSWSRRNWDKVRERYYESRSWCVCAALGVDEPMNDRVAVALTEAFGREPQRIEAARYLRLDSNQAGRELEQLGLIAGRRAPHKRVPDWVFAMPSDAQEAFLRGLCDADGHKMAIGHGWRLVSSSAGLLEDARRLALCCGVRPTRPKGSMMTAQPPQSPEPIVAYRGDMCLTFPEHDGRGASLARGVLPPGVRLDRVRAIEPGVVQYVYDLEVDGDESFVADGLVVHNTRWHEQDAAASMVAFSEVGVDFTVTRLPAIAEAPDPDSPDPTLRLPDPLGREPGELLGRFSRETVERKHAMLGSYLTAGLEQQRPAPAAGTEILREWFQIEETLPPAPTVAIASWDLKQKDKESGDYVVGQLWWRVGGGYWLMDQLRGQWNNATVKAAMALMKVRHPEIGTQYFENAGNAPELTEELRRGDKAYEVSDYVADKLGMSQAQREGVQALIRHGLSSLVPVVPKGEKSVRMRSVSPVIEGGNVHLPAGAHWLPGYLDEMAAFGSGSGHDDQVDATSQALAKIARPPASSTTASEAGAQRVPTRESRGAAPAGARVVVPRSGVPGR